FDCSSLPGCQLLVSSVKSCWVAIICSMMMRVWCPQKVSVRPDGSRMVVVARSLGWASHTIMGASCCRWGLCCCRGSYEQRCTLVWGACQVGAPALLVAYPWPGRVFRAAYPGGLWSSAEQV